MKLELNQAFQYTFCFTQEEVIQFANVSGDNNPIHLDADYAAQTIFKKPIIHGFLGASVFSKVLGTMFPGNGTVYLKQTMEFMRPMLVDTQYEAVFTVKEIDREKHRAVISTEILDSESRKTVTKGEAWVMNQEKI